MSEETLRALSWAEYDIMQIDADMGKLAQKLQHVGGQGANALVHLLDRFPLRPQYRVSVFYDR